MVDVDAVLAPDGVKTDRVMAHELAVCVRVHVVVDLSVSDNFAVVLAVVFSVVFSVVLAVVFFDEEPSSLSKSGGPGLGPPAGGASPDGRPGSLGSQPQQRPQETPLPGWDLQKRGMMQELLWSQSGPQHIHAGVGPMSPELVRVET